MSTLTITRGLPASGKTTWARQQAGLWRINRDDLRTMLRGSWEWGNKEHEETCTVAQHAAIRALLYAGINVVVDDTNLKPSVVEGLRLLARYQCAKVVIKDFTDVPLSTCLGRDAERGPGERVGEEVIRSVHDQYLAGF